jgi:signal recognition particle subunit SRP54
MTPAERAAPKILNGSRRARIARGSGTKVSDVNGLVERFAEAQKMMRSLAGGAGGGLPGMPGMPGMPGAGGKKSRGRAMAAPKGKGKGGRKGGARSGNPAKRALELQQAADRSSERGAGGLELPPDFELPAELKGMLPPPQR